MALRTQRTVKRSFIQRYLEKRAIKHGDSLKPFHQLFSVIMSILLLALLIPTAVFAENTSRHAANSSEASADSRIQAQGFDDDPANQIVVTSDPELTPLDESEFYDMDLTTSTHFTGDETSASKSIYFLMEFNLPEGGPPPDKTLDLDKQYYIYILEDFYADPPGLTPESDYIRGGLEADPQPIYLFGHLESDIEGYTKYLVSYNKEALQTLDDQLVSAFSKIYMNISSGYVSGDEKTPFMVTDESGVLLTQNPPPDPGDENPPPAPEPDRSVNVTKNVSDIYKPVPDPDNPDQLIRNRYITSDEPVASRYVDTGYLVKFTINVSISPGQENPGILKIIERLPAGYTAVVPGTSIKLDNYPPISVNDGWVLNLEQSTAQYEQWEYSLENSEDANIVAGQSFFRNFYATVNSSGVATPQTLINVAVAQTGNGETTPGTWTPYVGPKYYDLALLLNVKEQVRLGKTIYSSNETTAANNTGQPGDSLHDLAVMAGDQLAVRPTLLAQSPYQMKHLKVALYVPQGFVLDTTDPNNQHWVYDAAATQLAVSNHPEDARWLKLKVYIYEYPAERAISGSSSATGEAAYLTVVDKDANGFTDIDYYLAMEVASFADADGKAVGEWVTDSDSTPNRYPYDDLCANSEPYFGNAFDSNSYHELDSFTKQIDGRTNQHAQDNRFAVNGEKLPYWPNGYPTGTTSEDDFDFDRVIFKTPSPDPDKQELFYKLRLQSYNSIADAPYLDTALDIIGDSGKKLANAFPYLSSDGLVSDPNTWFIYRLTVNEQGLQDLQDITLTDTLPAGLKFIYGETGRFGTAISKVGVGLRAVSGLPLAADSEHPDGYVYQGYQLVEGDTVTLDGIGAYNAQNNGAGGFYGTSGQASNGFPDSYVSDVQLELSPDGQTFILTAAEVNHAQLDIYLVATLDTKSLQPEKEYQNVAVLEGSNVNETATEDSTVSWESQAGSAFVKKFVQTGNGSWADKNELNVLPGVGSEEQSVTYRLRLRTSKEIAPNDSDIAKLKDDLGAAGVPIISVGPIVYSGNIGTGTGSGSNYFGATGEIGGPKQLIANAASLITATYDPSTKQLSLSNPGTIPKWTELFIDFTVQYDPIAHGKAVVNYAGSRVTSLQPLRLILHKEDISGQVLTGADFALYYAQAGVEPLVADTSRPVLDSAGQSVRASGTGAETENYPNSFDFLPENYGSADHWDIVLVEIKAPDGYEVYVGSQYALAVNKDKSTGDLSFGAGTSVALSLVHGSSGDDLTVLNGTELLQIACEVDKDTIRRTSAAYVSLPGHEGFDNVGSEEYRYDFDFRSTSNVSADEFVVDDPLENVALGQIRIERFWTPVVWGDVDGLFNVWYKTNYTDDGATYSDVTANPSVAVPTYLNTGFKLWQAGLPSTERSELSIATLGLAADEYITAVRLEYGAVRVGFTSKNYADESLNGEHRMASHDTVNLPSNNADKIELYLQRSSSLLESYNQSLQGQAVDTLDALPADGIHGDVVDWTPHADTPYYSAELDDLTQAGALELLPAQYLVSAVHQMSDEDIVSSVTAKIARATMTDRDQDAVVTRELVTFTMPTVPLTAGAVELVESSLDAPDGSNIIGNWLANNLPLTGDTSLTIIIVALVCAILAGIVLILRTVLTGRRKHIGTHGRRE